MARSRILVVTLVAGLCLAGAPIPVHAGPRVPEVLERSFALARGLTVRAGAHRDAVAQRPARTLPIRANLIAMSFRANATDLEAIEDGVGIEARFRTARGWSGWEELHAEPDEGPDPGSPDARGESGRIFTAPIWVGTADKMAFRVTARPGAPAVSDLRAHVINSLGDARKPTMFHSLAAAVSRFLRGSSAEAMTAQPSIVTRARWGANESWRECCPRYAPTVQMAFVHHTVGTNSYSRSESPAIVRSIYKYHTSNRGWSDIGYNFLVDRYGQIFEGRYGGMTSGVIGAHVQGFNTGSTGVSLMGTFTSATPPSAMQSALKRLLAWKLDVHHVPPVGAVVMKSLGNPKYPAGRNVRFNRISGHRDGQQTACPGAKTYALLPSIRDGVNRIGLPKIYLPGQSTYVLRPDGDGVNEAVTVRSSLSQTLNWVVEFRTNAGMLLRRVTGRGASAAATWDGRTEASLLPTSGVVRWTLAADNGSASARPATGWLYLVTTHPDGTLIESSAGRAIIDRGRARTVPSQLVRDSWYRAGEPIWTGNAEFGRYEAGPAVGLREGTILAEAGGGYSIISGGIRRPFGNGVFSALGYTAASALTITASELAGLPSGPPWNDTTRHPPGAVVRAADGSVWTIAGGQRLRNPTDLVRRSWYRDEEVVAAAAGDLALAQGVPITYRDGTIFKLSDGSHYIVSHGVKHRFYDLGLFTAMGYLTSWTFSMSSAEAGTIRNGTAIAEPTIEAPPPRWARDGWGDAIGGGGR